MPDLCPHQPYQVYRRDIVFLSLSVLHIICPTCIADTSFEPVIIRIALHLHYECGPVHALTHEIILELLALQGGSLMFRLQICDVIHLFSFG